MSNYYVKTIERAAAPRSKRLRETGGYHSGGTSFPGGGYLPLTGGTITGDLRVRGNFIVGDVVVAMDANGRLHISKGVVSDGDLAAFGAEESEGGGSCGLDIARLWEELAAADASKVIDVSHIPGSVVLQDELTEILDDYPLTTEVNTALGGKADKDWVEEELAKYLLLTGGKISGDLEVTGTLKIGDAVLSYADGRLHVSSSVASDGDFVAFGDDEGGAGSGGLDVDRMWDELEAEGTEQIHASHLSDALTGYATQTYVDGRINDLINGAPAAYDTLKEIADVLEGNVDSIGDILTALGKKADKATTLAGYGITDAYTKEQIDEELAKYVTIAGNQDITGVKTFVNGIKIGSISLSVVDGRLHVSSTVTSDGDFVAFGDEDGASGSGGLDVARLWQELEAKDASKVIDASHIPSITKAKISDFPTKWAWADISGKPTTFAPSAHSHVISDVTGLQGELNSKWVWSESQIAGVKVNNAVAADKLATARKINDTEFLGTRDITTAKWGMARLVSIKDYTEDNVGATKSVDGSESFSLLLPQSIKVKTLDVDGVTLSVVDGRLHISATATSAGDFVAYGDGTGSSGSGGLDISQLWDELRADDSSKVIDISHIPSIPTSKITGLDTALASYATRTWVQQNFLTSVPAATSSVLGGIKVGYTEISGDKYYAVRVNSSNQAYVHVPWVNTTYSLSSFGITATAAEINKLDGIGTLLHSGNYTSYTVTKTGGGASGTWPISISGEAASATKAGYITPKQFGNQGTIGALKSSIVSAMDDGKNLKYPGQSYITSGSHVSTIMDNWSNDGFSIPSGSQEIFTRLDNYQSSTYGVFLVSGYSGGFYRLLRNDSSTWKGPFLLLDTENYHNIADSRYLKKAGGTMTGPLNINSSSEALVRYQISGSNKAATGYLASQGAYLYSWPAGKYLHITDAGSLLFGSSTVWHSGNDGSGSGLDADLLDGYQANDLMILGRSVNMLSGSTYSGYIPPLVLAMMRGAEQVENPTFLNGSNLRIYNNASDGSVTHTRVTDTTAGNGSGYVLKIHSSASAAPGGGGFTFTTSKAYRQATCVFRAKVPAGYTIDFGTNSVGSGGQTGQWLTERTGTGKWEWYACTVYFGSSPSSSHFYYLTPAANVDWYLAYAQVFYNSEALYVGMQAQKADRLTTSRTIWGRPFDGTGNVSGDMTGVGRIVASGPIRTHSINIECDDTGALGGYAAEINRTGFTDPLYLQHRGGNLYICANGGNVGIGTTSPAYKLDVAGTLRATDRITAARFIGNYLSDNSTNYWVGDAANGAGSGKTGLLLYAYGSRNIYLYTNSTQRMVVNASGYVGINTTSPSYLLDVAGEIRAISGITIGSTDDYGWYISTGTRISAGIDVARGVNVGSLLVSNAWADYSKVPTNGIYSKGDIITGGRLFIPSSEGNDKYYIRIE